MLGWRVGSEAEKATERLLLRHNVEAQKGSRIVQVSGVAGYAAVLAVPLGLAIYFNKHDLAEFFVPEKEQPEQYRKEDLPSKPSSGRVSVRGPFSGMLSSNKFTVPSLKVQVDAAPNPV